MGDGALYDAVGYVSFVLAMQRLRKNRAPDRTPLIITIKYAFIDVQLPLALLTFALRVKRRLQVVRMQTSQTRRARLHVPAIAYTHVRHK